jgi:hypothetical protein
MLKACAVLAVVALLVAGAGGIAWFASGLIAPEEEALQSSSSLAVGAARAAVTRAPLRTHGRAASRFEIILLDFRSNPAARRPTIAA